MCCSWASTAPRSATPSTSSCSMELGRAYELLERDDDLRCGVLFAHGEHFTGGLDLAEVGPALAEGDLSYPEDGRDPWRNDGKPGRRRSIAAAQGWCMTLGIELLLAADIRVASSDARFAQLEIQRGIYPFGGATIRLPREAGWGNAMRWLLTGDEYDATEAHRIGLDPGDHRAGRSAGPRHRARRGHRNPLCAARRPRNARLGTPSPGRRPRGGRLAPQRRHGRPDANRGRHRRNDVLRRAPAGQVHRAARTAPATG